MAKEPPPAPRLPPGEEAAVPAPAEGDAPIADPVRILLVDDRPDRLTALEATLNDLGPEVRLCMASSGREALRHLLQDDFAVILLDVHMPGMDGFETASLIRKRGRSELTPIIFITAFDPTEEHVRRGYSLGAVDYLFAPVQPEALRSKVLVFVDLYRMTAGARRKAEWLRREAERRAAAMETRLRGLTDRLSVGVFRAAPDGRLLEANRALLHLLGLPETGREISGTGLRLPRGMDLAASAGGDPANGSRGGPTNLRLELPGGRDRWFAVSVSRTGNGKGEILYDGFVEDITDRKRAEEGLRRAHEALGQQAEALARSNADLQRFAYVVSHDLQEPLRTATSYLDVLSRSHGDDLEGDARKYVEWTRESIDRMRQMTHGLLEFCAFETAGQKRRPVDCGALVDRVLAALRVPLEECGAVVTRDDLPTVPGDDIQLGQVFQNLIANALKFRRDGALPRIHIGSEERGGERVISVRDDGIGVDPGARDRLFEMFRRLPGSEPYPGHGLGLALCKRILERHGGRIWMEPNPEGGSIFRFTLDAGRTAEGASREGESGGER